MKAEASSVKATGKEAPQVGIYILGSLTGCTTEHCPKIRPFSAENFRHFFANRNYPSNFQVLVEMKHNLIMDFDT